MKQSMSRKGNWWDNACVESFINTFKCEFDDRVFATLDEAQADIFEYIEIWYNRQLRRSSLGYVSPKQFEQDQVALIPCLLNRVRANIMSC